MSINLGPLRTTNFKKIFSDAFNAGVSITAGGISVVAAPANRVAPGVLNNPSLNRVVQAPSNVPALATPQPAPRQAGPNPNPANGASSVSNVGKFALIAGALVLGLAYVSVAHRGR